MTCWNLLGKAVSKFYFLLWIGWFLRLTFFSLLGASFLSFLVTVFIYMSHATQSLTDEAYTALFSIFKFWFVTLWSLTLLISLFRSLKYIFNSCINGYKLTLIRCYKDDKNELIEVVGFGDLLPVWRKWLTLLMWLVGSEMILALVFMQTFTSYDAIFDWFNVYVLYAFIGVAGYFSFVFLSARCKRVRVKKC